MKYESKRERGREGGREGKYVSWCFMLSQPVQLYQGNRGGGWEGRERKKKKSEERERE